MSTIKKIVLGFIFSGMAQVLALIIALMWPLKILVQALAVDIQALAPVASWFDGYSPLVTVSSTVISSLFLLFSAYFFIYLRKSFRPNLPHRDRIKAVQKKIKTYATLRARMMNLLIFSLIVFIANFFLPKHISWLYSSSIGLMLVSGVIWAFSFVAVKGYRVDLGRIGAEIQKEIDVEEAKIKIINKKIEAKQMRELTCPACGALNMVPIEGVSCAYCDSKLKWPSL